jgi:hypothetical protein
VQNRQDPLRRREVVADRQVQFAVIWILYGRASSSSLVVRPYRSIVSEYRQQLEEARRADRFSVCRRRLATASANLTRTWRRFTASDMMRRCFGQSFSSAWPRRQSQRNTGRARKCSGKFSATIQQQIEMLQSDPSPADLAEKTIDYAEAKAAYFEALRAEMQELMKIATGKEARSPELDTFAAAFAVAGEDQERWRTNRRSFC